MLRGRGAGDRAEGAAEGCPIPYPRRLVLPSSVTCALCRRELFAKAGAALAGFAAVQSASAKAGQFSKIEIFSITGTPAISSPYQPGGPKAGPTTDASTFATQAELFFKFMPIGTDEGEQGDSRGSSNGAAATL